MEIVIPNPVDPSIYLFWLADAAHEAGIDLSQLQISQDGNRVEVRHSEDGNVKVEYSSRYGGGYQTRSDPMMTVAVGIAISVGSHLGIEAMKKLGRLFKEKIRAGDDVTITYGHDDAYR